MAQALPVSSLGFRLDDNSLCIALGLHLGTPLCEPHQCQNCGAEVDVMGRNALSCKKSTGRQQCHGALNDIIHHALLSSQVPACLEPVGLSRSDGKWCLMVLRMLLVSTHSHLHIRTWQLLRLELLLARKNLSKRKSMPIFLTHTFFCTSRNRNSRHLWLTHLVCYQGTRKRLHESSRDYNATRYLIQRLSMVM